MSHVTQRHIARLLGQQSRQMPLLVAAMVAGAIAASKNPQAGAALAVGGQAAIAQQQLNFSRDMEREADRVGYAVMSQAGFAPQGFVSMFEKLQAASRVTTTATGPTCAATRSPPSASPTCSSACKACTWRRKQRTGRRCSSPPARGCSRARRRRAARLGRRAAQPGFARQPLAQRAGALYAAALARAELRELPQAQALAEQLASLMAEHPRALRQVHLLQAELALRADQAPRRCSCCPPWRPRPTRSPSPAAHPSRRRAALRRAPLGAAHLAKRGSVGPEPSRPRRAAAAHAGAAAHRPGGRGGVPAAHLGRRPCVRRRRLAGAGPGRRSPGPDAALAARRGRGRAGAADYAGAVDRWRAAQDYSRQHPGDGAALIEASIVDARMREAQALLRQQRLDEEKQRR
jgi:hypothetical protein